jgi:Cd2+/Zn2+-exporting ATPase
MIDSSALTGESVPKEAVLEQILSGCVNITGLISVKVIKEFGESNGK